MDSRTIDPQVIDLRQPPHVLLELHAGQEVLELVKRQMKTMPRWLKNAICFISVSGHVGWAEPQSRRRRQQASRFRRLRRIEKIPSRDRDRRRRRARGLMASTIACRSVT